MGEHDFGGLIDNRVETNRQTGKQKIRFILQVVSAMTLGLAFLSAMVVVALRLIHWFHPSLFLLPLRSGIPLILIGLSFACLQFAVRRTRSQCILGLSVSVAFMLWGIEQFLPNQAIVQVIDDMVVSLFVLDLGIVICGLLKGKNGESAL
jgi:amino acid transporter